MKRNIAPSSGSSDEDKASLKKAKKENYGKRKSTEAEITETMDGSNSMYRSDRSGQDNDYDRNVKEDTDESSEDTDGSSENSCGIDLAHKLHSGNEISNDTFSYNCNIINRDIDNKLMSCLKSIYNLQLENNIDSSIRVTSPKYQRDEVREKESSKNHFNGGICHEVVPPIDSLLDELSTLDTLNNSAEENTRKRLFCCTQSAYNYLTEDIDDCVRCICNCLNVPRRNDENDQNVYDGDGRREISGIILSPLLYTRNKRRNIDSLPNCQNDGMLTERRELNCRERSTYNYFSTNSDESSREHTNSQSGQEKNEYDKKCLGGSAKEIDQNSSPEHSLWDETNIDAFIDYVETVHGDTSIRRLLFCCPQSALNYLLKDIDNEGKRVPCSCQNVHNRNGSNWCDDRGSSKETCESHSHEHRSCGELRPSGSGAESCETAVRYSSTVRIKSSDQEVSLDEVYVLGHRNVANVGLYGQPEVSNGNVIEIIDVADSGEDDNQAEEEFHSVGESAVCHDVVYLSDDENEDCIGDSHKARVYNDVEDYLKAHR